jgi:hypothetical protein
VLWPRTRASGFQSQGKGKWLPSRYVASVDHTGLLRRSLRCSVITQRVRMQQRPFSATASVSACMCGLVLCGSSAGQPRRKKGLPHPMPAESHVAVCICRRREKRPSSSTKQANELGRISRIAPRIWCWLVQSRASRRAGAWRSTRFYCIRQQARCAT